MLGHSLQDVSQIGMRVVATELGGLHQTFLRRVDLCCVGGGHTMHFRRATQDDVTPIEKLVSCAYGKYVERIGRKPKPMSADYTIAVAQHQVWVVVSEDGLGAVLELVPHADHLLIENVAVDPKRQGTGLGGALLRFAEDQARRQGLSEVRLYTNALFTENLAIYRKAGYRETHREPIGAGQAVHMCKSVA